MYFIQGELLPDEGNEHFIISGDHQSQLTVVNFTEALDRTVIFCQIAFHGNIDIAQFTLLLPGKLCNVSSYPGDRGRKDGLLVHEWAFNHFFVDNTKYYTQLCPFGHNHKYL